MSSRDKLFLDFFAPRGKVQGSRLQALTLAWLNRCRRLAKDWENLNLTALMFLPFASIRLMLQRLCRGR
jgi:hypothetical protein